MKALLLSLSCSLTLPCAAQDVASLAQHSTLQFELNPRARLLVQPPQRAALAPVALQPSRATESGVGLEFKLRPASSSRDLQQLLRLQLSQRSALQFRPRGGGLAVTYREQF
jgi:hypothetical protein